MSADEEHGEPDAAPRAAGAAKARYAALLDAFGATDRRPSECVRHLEAQGLTHGQARNAVYRYRQERGLSQPRARSDSASEATRGVDVRA
jgi:hypothetical protein